MSFHALLAIRNILTGQEAGRTLYCRGLLYPIPVRQIHGVLGSSANSSDVKSSELFHQIKIYESSAMASAIGIIKSSHLPFPKWELFSTVEGAFPTMICNGISEVREYFGSSCCFPSFWVSWMEIWMLFRKGLWDYHTAIKVECPYSRTSLWMTLSETDQHPYTAPASCLHRGLSTATPFTKVLVQNSADFSFTAVDLGICISGTSMPSVLYKGAVITQKSTIFCYLPCLHGCGRSHCLSLAPSSWSWIKPYVQAPDQPGPLESPVRSGCIYGRWSW